MRNVTVLAHVAVVVAVAASAAGQGPAPNRQSAASARSEGPAYEGLLDQYCVSCHNEAMSGQGTVPFAFEHLDVTDVGADAAMWETVARKLRLGMMPPLGRPRPDRVTNDRFVTWLEGELDAAAAANPRPQPSPRASQAKRHKVGLRPLPWDEEEPTALPWASSQPM